MRLTFGRFVLDEERRELREGARPVHISPKAYELLKFLALHRPRALSKREILDHLWPETFVAEVSLAALISELRSALGEHRWRGGTIRTVHGYGYAFDAEAAAAPAVTPAAAPHTGEREAATRMGPSAPAMWLVVGDREFLLSEGMSVVGRDQDARIRLDELSVSRRHAVIAVAGSRVSVSDLSSRNGTWVRGERVAEGEEAILRDGDRVRFGSVAGLLRCAPDPLATRTV